LHTFAALAPQAGSPLASRFSPRRFLRCLTVGSSLRPLLRLWVHTYGSTLLPCCYALHPLRVLAFIAAVLAPHSVALSPSFARWRYAHVVRLPRSLRSRSVYNTYHTARLSLPSHLPRSYVLHLLPCLCLSLLAALSCGPSLVSYFGFSGSDFLFLLPRHVRFAFAGSVFHADPYLRFVLVCVPFSCPLACTPLTQYVCDAAASSLRSRMFGRTRSSLLLTCGSHVFTFTLMNGSGFQPRHLCLCIGGNLGTAARCLTLLRVRSATRILGLAYTCTMYCLLVYLCTRSATGWVCLSDFDLRWRICAPWTHASRSRSSTRSFVRFATRLRICLVFLALLRWCGFPTCSRSWLLLLTPGRAARWSLDLRLLILLV